MALIYLVTTGDYSSYSIQAAFAEEVHAATYAGIIGGEVETFELRTDVPDLVNRLVCRCFMMATGEIYGAKEDTDRDWSDRVTWPPCEVSINRRQPYYTDLPESIEIVVGGSDIERVRKVMAEKVAWVKANVETWLAMPYDEWKAMMDGERSS